MAYTTVAKVNALLGADAGVDESTNPNKAQVDIWITGTDALLDVAITGGGGTAPATNATLLAALDVIEAQNVAWLVLVSRRAAGEDPNEHPFRKAFEDFIEKLEEGEIGVSGSTVHAPWSHTMDADVDSTTDPLGPAIRKDQVF